MCFELDVIQRKIKGVFERLPDKHLDSIEIAGRALGEMTVTESEISSFRRGLRGLVRRALLADLGRHWRWGRRHFALPAKAESLRHEFHKQFHEKPFF